MNALESYNGTIMGEECECAQFTIDTLTSPFVLSDITKAGEQYTFGFWIRADTDGSISTCGKTITATTEWVRHVVTFTATGPDVKIFFATAGVYYIFHPQIELGNMDTAYAPAPEDLDDSESVNEINGRLQTVYENVTSLELTATGIQSTVSDVVKRVDEVDNEVVATTSELTALKQASDSLSVEVQKITDDGVKKVTTTTGTFDDEGMTIDRNDSPTKTTITPDGMIVTDKSAGGNKEVLKATSDGVEATDLHARTYLIVGGRSRFENYGTDRTGCFWIGG